MKRLLLLLILVPSMLAAQVVIIGKSGVVGTAQFGYAAGTVIAPSFVQSWGSNGQTNNNPMSISASVSAGNGAVIMFQLFAGTEGDTYATSITTSNNDTCYVDVSGNINSMGLGHCVGLVGGSTTFYVNMNIKPAIWAVMFVSEVANLHGVDCAGTPIIISDTGTAGATWYTNSCTTSHQNTIMFATASDESEIGLNNGNVGCCVTGNFISSGDPGGVGSWQTFSSIGSYRSGFASTGANDSGEASMVIYW